MLVLTRRIGENYLIGETVVSLLSITGNQVRIGISAEPKITIVREELLDVEILEAIYRKIGFSDTDCTRENPSNRSKTVYFRDEDNGNR